MIIINESKRERFYNINIPVRFGSNTTFSSTTDINTAARNNLLALLLTAKGERLFTKFGTVLKGLIFEQGENTNSVETKCLNDISTFLPYIEVLVFDINYNEKTYNVFIKYRVKDTGYIDSINLII